MSDEKAGEGATLRRQLIERLAAGACGVRELSQELHQSEKEIYRHLEHVGRTVHRAGGRLVVSAALCQQCGYVFQDRTRTTPPGRCPHCRSTRIRRSRYSILWQKGEGS